MKKTVNYRMLRSIFALLLGAILMLWPGSAILYLIIASGLLFIIPGLISLIEYVARDRAKHPDMPFPLAGIGSLLFGVVLGTVPHFFVNVLMYLLGIILALGGIEQIVTLVGARKWTTVPAPFYVAPALILLAGILVLFKPFNAAETLFMLIGVTCLIYGLVGFVHWLRFTRKEEPKEDLSAN